MFCLEVIRAMNAVPPAPPAVELRESSAVRSRGGIVVHSASLRSTCFIPAGRYAKRWWTRWQAADTAKRHRMADKSVYNAQ